MAEVEPAHEPSRDCELRGTSWIVGVCDQLRATRHDWKLTSMMLKKMMREKTTGCEGAASGHRFRRMRSQLRTGMTAAHMLVKVNHIVKVA